MLTVGAGPLGEPGAVIVVITSDAVNAGASVELTVEETVSLPPGDTTDDAVPDTTIGLSWVPGAIADVGVNVQGMLWPELLGAPQLHSGSVNDGAPGVMPEGKSSVIVMGADSGRPGEATDGVKVKLALCEACSCWLASSVTMT